MTTESATSGQEQVTHELDDLGPRVEVRMIELNLIRFKQALGWLILVRFYSAIILDKVCNNLYATLLLSVTVCRKFLSFSLLTQEKLHSGPFNISITKQLVHLNGAFLHVEYYRERPLNASSGKHGAECSVYTPWRTGPPISCLLSMLCQTHNVIMTLGRLVTSAQSIYLSIMPGL